MSELELFLLMGVLTPNFNTMDLVKILEKKSKISHSYRSGHNEGDVVQNHVQKKKVKNQDFMGKTNYFLSSLPFSQGCHADDNGRTDGWTVGRWPQSHP
jgi:hypothetical protein